MIKRIGVLAVALISAATTASVVTSGNANAAAAAAGPAFVQVVSAQPQTKESTVTVQYIGAQNAGDTNILAIGWGDTAASITSVTDSAGNTYKVASPMTRGTMQSQAMYYAADIKASAKNTNTVTVKFSVRHST